ncbi:MAG: DUF1570 domain-containing protein [Planctomycetota bacterium]|nr:DUF1570 domain-containing protein [Planctomycetota bacterium]
MKTLVRNLLFHHRGLLQSIDRGASIGCGHGKSLLLLVVFLAIQTGIGQARQLTEGPWWERAWEDSSEHYWIKTDLPREEAREIARHLDVMYREFSRRLASLPSRAPDTMNVYLFKNRRDYELTLRARFGVNAGGTGGIFFVTGPHHGLALWTEDLSLRRIRHVIQHEGFHQFAWSRFGGDLPNWVNEGLAEFFGLSVLVGEAFIIGQSHQRTLEGIREAIEQNEHRPFHEMIAISNQHWMRIVNEGSATQLYDQAWSMVHFLVYGDEGRYTQAFERYLRLINNGLPSEEAFKRAFETSATDKFEERWINFMQQVEPSSFITALERIEFLAAGTMKLASEGVFPESLDELKASLLVIDFEYTFLGHSRHITLRADQDDNFSLPADRRTEKPVNFVVTRPSQRRMSLRERKLEEVHPSPSTIFTESLAPRELTIVWRRDKEDPDFFTYQIKVR